MSIARPVLGKYPCGFADTVTTWRQAEAVPTSERETTKRAKGAGFVLKSVYLSNFRGADSNIIVYACLMLLAFVSFSCSDVEDLDNFDVSVGGETTVSAATPIELILGDFPLAEDFAKFDITEGQGFDTSKYDRDDVDSIHVKSLKMSALSPDGSDLSFLGTVVFYVETDDLPKKEFARREGFPEGESTVWFDTTGDEMKRYFLTPDGVVSVEIQDSARPEEETVIYTEVVFDVDVNVL